MDESEWLAERFEANRAHLQAVAYRMLGSSSEADDAVQEAWLRLSRSGAGDIRNLSGWLTTVVSRVCLDILRARKARHEQPLEAQLPEPVMDQADETIPEHEALLADSLGLALLVVLETLSPAERVAFVLHDLFALPFEEIAPILERSSTAARQLASRARRRVRGVTTEHDVDVIRQRELVEAFLAASRHGDFDALLALLDPQVVVRADRAAAPLGVAREAHGAASVAEQALIFKPRARFAHLALVDGAVGIALMAHERLILVIAFKIRGEKIIEMDVRADRAHLSQLDLEILDN
jgi:RNA polymerase sigma factor (sigma-70 family)